MLYGFIDELPIVKRLRYELNLMVKYIILCKQPNKPKIIISNHLVDSDQINFYSLSDLQDLPALKKTLTDFHSELFEHITKNCETCKGNGFYCELCVDKGGILFPFLSNISMCPKCHAVFHRNCYYRKKICKRCKRIEKKEAESISMKGLKLSTVSDESRFSKESVDNVDTKLKLNNNSNDILNQMDEPNLAIEEDKNELNINQINESNLINEQNEEILSQKNEFDEKDKINVQQFNHQIVKQEIKKDEVEVNQNTINDEFKACKIGKTVIQQIDEEK